VSGSYLAERRGGPRRASIMMALVYGFIAFLAHRQREQIGQDAIVGPLAFTGVLMAGIGFFVVRRMKKMTLELENSLFTVTADGIVAESGNGRFTMKASDISTITMYRTVFAPKATYFVVAGKGGDAALPPLENADTFAREIQAALPTIPFVQKRKLIVNFGD
jgi:hypothetical protein